MCVCDFMWVKERRSNLGSLVVKGVETWEDILFIAFECTFSFGKMVRLQTGAAWCILGPKAKIDHFVWDAKLLLINMNYVEFFFFLKKFYKQKKFDKIFHTCWCGKLIVVSKTMILVVGLDEN